MESRAAASTAARTHPAFIRLSAPAFDELARKLNDGGYNWLVGWTGLADEMQLGDIVLIRDSTEGERT